MKSVLNFLFSKDKNVFIFTFLDLFVLGFNSFVIVPILVKILPIEILPEYTLYLTYNAIFIVVFQFGLISTFSRFYFCEDEKKTEKNIIYTIHLILSSIGLVLMTTYYFLTNKNSHLIFFGSILVSILSFYISLEIVYMRLINRIKFHYFLQVLNIFSFVFVLFIISFIAEITTSTIVYVNIFTGLLFSLLFIKRKGSFEKISSINKIDSIFIKETVSFYILNIIYALLTRAIPVLFEPRISNKLMFSQLSISLIYSSISFVLVASFNKFSLVNYFKLDEYDKNLKNYFLIYHILTTIFCVFFFKIFFNLFFNSQFVHLWTYFSLFFLCNFIWNLSLIENMNLQKNFNVNVIRNIYIIIFLFFCLSAYFINKEIFNIKIIFHLQLVISIIYFSLNYYYGKHIKESLLSKYLTIVSFLTAIISYAVFAQHI
jgi:O-antigen/teichoic acid export membrane protein